MTEKEARVLFGEVAGFYSDFELRADKTPSFSSSIQRISLAEPERQTRNPEKSTVKDPEWVISSRTAVI